MRILQINTHDRGGGAEAICRGLHQAYLARGHDAWLAVGHKSAPLANVVEIPHGPTAWWRLWHRVRLAALDRKIALLPRLASRFAPFERRERHYRAVWETGEENFSQAGSARVPRLIARRPEILQGHNLHGGLGYFNLNAIPALSRRFPFVLTLHDAWLLSGHCAHSMECNRWIAGCGECPDLTIYPEIARDTTARSWQRKRALFQRARLYVATPSRWLMTRVEQSMLQPAIIEARVIPHGIDLSVFTPGSRAAARDELGLPAEGRILVFGANGIRRSSFKDFATLRRAVALVAERLRSPVTFLAVGDDGPPETIGRATVTFVPYQPSASRMARYFQAADAAIHAARADTFPNVVMEAQACGCPVVATAVGGIPEQIEHDATGLLVPAGDSESMARHLLKLLENAEFARQICRNAAEHARQNYDLKQTAKRYLEWFAEILQQRTAEPREVARNL